MDCFVAFSACPQDVVSIQRAHDNTPRSAHFEVLYAGFPDPPVRRPWVPGGARRGPASPETAWVFRAAWQRHRVRFMRVALTCVPRAQHQMAAAAIRTVSV